MLARRTRIASLVFGLIVLAANLAWALGFRLGETKEQLQLKYEVSATDHGTGRVTINLTIVDQGRLRPLNSVDLVVPANDGSNHVDLSLQLATKEVDGKLVARAHLKKEWAERAEIQLRTSKLDGKSQPLTWYYHEIRVADYTKNRGKSAGGTDMSIELKSSAFSSGSAIPKKYTGDGADKSPPLQWSEPPKGTQSLALICEDPDAPRGTWAHWVLFNLPAESRNLQEGVPTEKTLDNGAKQGNNDFGNIGYGGPAPPKGKPHRYFFKLYALDHAMDLPPGATRTELAAAAKDHILAEGELMGTYGR